MSEVIEDQMQDTIDLISRALKDATLDIEFIDQNKAGNSLSTVRCHMLLATLRNTITHTRNLESGFDHYGLEQP